jgi:hypothetical protein
MSWVCPSFLAFFTSSRPQTDSISPAQPESLLETTTYQGFPIVKSRKNLTLLGDVSRSELKIAIGESPISS